MQFLYSSNTQIIIESFILSFIISFITVPIMLKIAKQRKIYCLPNERTSHKTKIPPLGGVAIFMGFIISSMLFIDFNKIASIQYIFVAMLILVAVGFKDDIIGMRYKNKFIGQIIVAFIVIAFADIRIGSFHGFLGIGEINIFVSYFISLFFIVGVINAYNLIDGIDGLASGLAIVATLSFGSWFFLIGEYQLTILSIAMIGALIAFFIFNFFAERQKIFMGDTGSLLIGLFLSILAIKFIKLNNISTGVYYIKASPAVAFGIMIIPIADTIRVMSVRMLRGLSPFNADKRHLHHYILELTQSHKKTTLIIVSASICFTIISFLLSDLRIWQLSTILIVLISIFSFISYYKVITKRKKKNLFIKPEESNKNKESFNPLLIEKMYSSEVDVNKSNIFKINRRKNRENERVRN